MTMKISSQINTQSVMATQDVDDPQNEPQQTEAPNESSNPAAEDYANGSEPTGTVSGGPQSYDEALGEIERQVAEKEFYAQEIERINAELQYYLENADLTPEQAEAIRQAIINGRVLLSQTNRELNSLMQTRDSMLTYGSEADWDGDGLTNDWEVAHGANKLNIDTDGDGLSDSVERALNYSGVDSHWNMADSNGNGVTDYVENYENAASAADALGIDNWDLGPRGGGSSISGGPDSDDPVGSGSDSDPVSDSDGEAGGVPEVGPEPGDGAIEVNVGDEETEEVEEASGTEETDETEEAGSQSMGTQSVNESSEEGSGNMGIQTDGEASEESTPPQTKTEIAQELESHNYTADETEVITVDGDWDPSENTLADVVINLPAGSDKVLCVQEGDDLIFYVKTEDGTFKKIFIEQGTKRKIFIQDAGGANDVVIFKNVDQQVLMGATQALEGKHMWASGVFVQLNDGDGYEPIANSAENDTPEGPTWGFDYVTTGVDEEAPDPAPQNQGIEDVYTIWDGFRDNDGKSSGAVTLVDQTIESDAGTQYLYETYELDNSGEKVDIHIPETVNGVAVREVIVKQDGADDYEIILKDRSGKILKKIRLNNGIKYGNASSGGAEHRVAFVLPNGLNDPKGYYENGYQFGGIKIDFSQLNDEYVKCVGGKGDDWIIGSNYTGDDGTYYDLLVGNDGNDIIEAGQSATEILGGAGHDSLVGSADSDKMDGGLGNDMIDGSFGNDSLYGGSGDDVIVGKTAPGEMKNIVDGGSGSDTTNLWSDVANMEDMDHTLDDVQASNIDELIDMIGLEDPEEIQKAKDAVSEWLESENKELVSQKIYTLFHKILSIRKESYWTGEAPASGSYDEFFGGEVEGEADQEEEAES